MNKIIVITLLLLILPFYKAFCQTEITKQEFDSLKRVIVQMDTDLKQIDYNLSNAKRSLKTGVFIATIGYSVTIMGGQLLGVNPDLGKALLYTGGAIGIGGTVLLVKGFNRISLGLPRRK